MELIKVADPSKSALTMLNNLLNNLISRAVYRVFNAADNSVIKDRRFLGLCGTESLYRQRRAKLEKKTSTVVHPVL